MHVYQCELRESPAVVTLNASVPVAFLKAIHRYTTTPRSGLCAQRTRCPRRAPQRSERQQITFRLEWDVNGFLISLGKALAAGRMLRARRWI